MKVFLVVLFFFIFLGFLKLRFFVSYDEKDCLCVVFRVVFLKFLLYPRKSKVRKKNKTKNIKSDEKKKKKKNKDILQIFELVEILREPFLNLLKFLNRGFRVLNFNFYLRICATNSFKTALNFSYFCCFFYGFLSLFETYCKVKRKKIDIKPDFLAEKTNIKIFIAMKISFGRLFVGLLIFMFSVFFRVMKKGLLNNKRSG